MNLSQLQMLSVTDVNGISEARILMKHNGSHM